VQPTALFRDQKVLFHTLAAVLALNFYEG